MDTDAATSLAILHGRIRECRRCVDDGYPIVPPPLVRARDYGLSAPAPFLVIGQAPSLTDQRVGLTYQGPAAQRLVGWLLRAGFRDEQVGSDIAMTALTKCFPGRLAGKSSDRAPTSKELANCRPWLDDEFALLCPAVVILFGKMAIDAFLRPALPLEARIGRRFELGGRVYIPLPHSSGASTWLNASSRQALLAAAIELIADERRRLGL